MELFTTKRHRLWYNQHFQEQAQQVEEESDGLLHGRPIRWRFGLVVTLLGLSTKLLYVEPG